jgi:hypothetical protein
MGEASPDFETRGVRGAPSGDCGANPFVVRVDVRRTPDVKAADRAEALHKECRM